MTDFSHARVVKCKICGTRFCVEEGPLCDCFTCENCGEGFAGDYKANIQNTENKYCENCVHEVAERCDCCGDWYLKKDLHYTRLVHPQLKFCPTCDEEEICGRCDLPMSEHDDGRCPTMRSE